MKLSGGNGIIDAALADLHGGLTVQGAAGAKLSRVSLAGVNGWGLIWILSRLFGRGEPNPKEARHTADILDMWRSLEASFYRLGSADKDRVRAANHKHDPRFGGFGTKRQRPYEILEHMIVGIGRWQEFVQRYGPSQSSRLEMHLAMCRAYETMQPESQERDPSPLTTEELIRIVRSG